MTHEQFNTMLENRLMEVKRVIGVKAQEYATADRMHNFKRSAAFTGETPEQVCVGFMVKHLTSILDLVDQKAAGKQLDDAMISEKCGDAINYLILLEAMLLVGA